MNDEYKIKLLKVIKSTFKSWQGDNGKIQIDNGNIDSLMADIAGEIDSVFGTKENKLMTIVIVLKNGKELKVKCEEFDIRTGYSGQLTGYTIKGIIENKPIYLDAGEIQYIYRVISDEC